ncbi:MAG: response regulator transcription factor [Clostridia bacterium]|nr:response regulator transcription factor [Clostridia bacterium]
MRILLAEDERSLARAISRLLEKNFYSVDTVYNGADALTYLENGHYDAAILDIMMPEMDGITALKKLREKGDQTPALFLSARAEITDRIRGLDSGANYYLTKPFETEELMAVLRAITRSPQEVDSKIRVGNIALDRNTFELSSAMGEFRLTKKEFQLLELLMSNPHHIISTERLMEKIWGYDSDTEATVVWVYVSFLRKKFAALGANLKIRSHRNAGYSLEQIDD